MQAQCRRVSIEILIFWLPLGSSYSPFSPGGHLLQFLQLLSDTCNYYPVIFYHNSIPSRSITASSAGWQTPTSTKLTSTSVAASITVLIARNVSSGEIPHAAMSTSDHRVKHPLCTSDPKTTTRETPNCSFNKLAAHRAVSHARASRNMSSPCSCSLFRFAVVT